MQARTREQWAALVAAFERTGQRTTRFCATRGIHPKTFAWWRWQLRAGARASRDELKLLSVDVVDRRGVADSSALVVTVGDVEIRFSSSIDVDYVGALVARVRGA